MATILWNQEIDKNVDWAGDISTGGAPVSGKYVQQFIKDTLAKKFGFMYYDRSALKYYVFADEEDYNTYSTDPTNYASLLLASFDAPAPATISIIDNSNLNVTTLLSTTGRKIWFNYYIIDQSGNAVAENVSMRVVFSRGGETETLTQVLSIDREHYNDKEVGTKAEIEIDSYLREEGTYTITITLTGLNTQASTTLTFFYTVVNLELSLENFKYYIPFDSTESKFEISFTSTGAARIVKTMDVFIDGEELIQNKSVLGYNNAFSSGDSIGTAAQITEYLTLYNKDINGNIVKWGENTVNTALAGKTIFAPGKHSIQLRVSIPGDTPGTSFYSKTKYFDFIVVDPTSAVEPTYLLYATETEPGTVFNVGAPIQISGQQYTPISLSVAAVDISGRKTDIIYSIVGEESGISVDVQHNVSNQEIDPFEYIFDTPDTYTLSVKDGYTDTVQISAIIEVTAFNTNGETLTEQDISNLLVKYSALNRSNSEVNKTVWTNSAVNFSNVNPYPAIFHNVLWNEQSGWNGEALVLRNGAQVEFPVNMFNSIWGDLGLTFEIDFETFDVQDDDAILMDFSDPAGVNNSFIKITATSATLRSQNNISLKTNFKDNTRNKIAFTFNPTADVINGVSQGSGNTNLVFIYVNGVLDRAGKWGNGTHDTDTVEWTNPTTNSIIIGNPHGEAGVKIYSIRIYRSALLPEQAFMNYVIDQGKNIPAIINKNHVLDEEGNISLDLVKQQIPTLVLYTDYTGINNRKNKKDNTQYALQYFDPIDPSLNFYVRNGWLSCQGTSSMNYPTKNLRPYFNKQRNDKTFDFSMASSADAQALASKGVDVSANFNTEFWPVSEYAGNEEDVVSYVDTAGIVPYSVNKKEIVKDKQWVDKEGSSLQAYHEIAQGKTNEYKIDLANKYAAKVPVFYLNGKATIVVGGKEKTVDHYDIVKATESKSVRDIITELVTAGTKLYISAYRPLRRTGMELGSEDYWKYIKQLRYSGQKIFTEEIVSDENGNVLGYKYNKAKKLNKDTEYYGLGPCWRQYDEPLHYSGWTDKWTLKADYAESSMCHNSGVARIWGNALRNIMLNGQAVGLTKAQGCSTDPYFIDIRTSCDGKPVVLFVKNPSGINATTGNYEYGAATFAGLFNIMTDKSSTPLFGFEDIKDENNNYLFVANASLEDDKTKIPVGQEDNKVQCWEFLQNGSLLGTGNSLAFDSESSVTYDKATSDSNGLNIGEDRPIFTDFEPRWPESGEAYHEGDSNFYQDDVFGVESNAFETFWNWVYFTKPAVKYQINASTDSPIDGYDFSPYVKFETMADVIAYRGTDAVEPIEGREIYIQWNNSGNIAYAKEGETYQDEDKNEVVFKFNPNITGQPLYKLSDDINYEDVKKTINNAKIGDVWGSDVYEVPVYGFDANNRFINEDGSIDQDRANDYRVTVFMKRNGNTYYYTNSYGQEVVYPSSSEIDSNDFKRAGDGYSYSNKTFLQFFSETKYEHLDVYKVAAYFIYIMRFGAVDQVVKNCMFTTEDGKHWYFINYDNDTVLGVRNDAQLIFNWDFDRDTYDYSGNSYGYAGAKSVLWNNLTEDSDFMDIVKSIDAVMYSSGLLSAKAVLEYLDEKQMNTWNPRLYNKQEEIKYLSTFKNNFETDKFLLFMQGTRQSHRQWWVNHRWELYDAMWSNGSYADKNIRFYEIITEASDSNELPFLTITASSKYYFSCQKNNRNIDGGFVELKSGESASFSTKSNIAIGDPMCLVGPHKLKVLNFRPGIKYLATTLSLNESYDITESDGVTKRKTTWVNEGGTMMTKLLIGDGVNSSALTNISGLNDITSLEEIDIRKCNMLTASPSVNKLTNLHIFRASGSTCTIFEPAQGVSLYEVSLPSDNAAASGEVYVLDDAGQPIQETDGNGNPLTDGEGNPVYKTQRVTNIYALQTLTLNNVNFMTQNTEYVVYQEGSTGDKLPYEIDEEGNISGIYTNERAYKYSLPDANGRKAIFDVQPTSRLNNVTFNNVTGLDTKQFVLDWKDNILRNGEALGTRVLTLNGVNWEDMRVSDLVELVKGQKLDGTPVATFNIKEFTGTVKVISDDGSARITLDEYNKLIEFFGEKAFTPTNSVYITCSDGIFYQPTNNTKQAKLTSFEDSISFNQVTNTGADIYKVVRGDRFSVKATIFPNVGDKYVYALTVINRGNPIAVTPSASYVYSHLSSGAELINNADGTATLVLTEGTGYNNYIFAITVCKVNEDGTVNYNAAAVYNKDNNIYVGSEDKVVPVANEIRTNIDNIENVSTFTITDNEVHTVKFVIPTTSNADIKGISAEVSELSVLEFINIDTDNYRLNGNILEVDFSGTITPSEPSFSVDFKINFDTTITSAAIVTKSINFNIDAIYITEISLLTGEDFSEVAPANIVINKSGEYKFKVDVNPTNYNVQISELSLTVDNKIYDANNHVEITDIEDGIFSINVTNVNSSFIRQDEIIVILYDEFDTNKTRPITTVINVEVSVVYPENTYIAIQDYINKNVNNYITTDNSNPNNLDIYVLNAQGTVNTNNVTGFNNLLTPTSGEYIRAKVFVKPQPAYDINGNLIEREPTEPFSINIHDDVTVTGTGDIATSENVKVVIEHTEDGNNILAISIAANTNIITTVTISGTYSVDKNTTTDDDIIDEKPFTISINYTLASANTYAKLTPYEYYLVDEDSNYYLVELDSSKQIVAESDARISRALALGIKFVGIGLITGGSQDDGNGNIIVRPIVPHFIALVTKSNLYTNDNGNLNREDTPTYKLLPNTARRGLSDPSTKYTYNGDPDSIFIGYNNTDAWKEIISESNDYINCGFNTIYNLFDRRKVATYIPSLKELEQLFGSSTITCVDLDSIITGLNNKSTTARPINFLKVADLYKDFPTDGAGDKYLTGLITSIEGYNKFLMVLSSSSNQNGASTEFASFYTVSVNTETGIIETKANGSCFDSNITANGRIYHFTLATILPFVKVS